jgi:predicted nuclease of predicted toxin-antitoxin system
MRLLIDENLSESLVEKLRDLFPQSLHVRLLGHGGATDQQVWDLAREHGCMLLTRDEDYAGLSVLRGAPPKVILVRLGNCTTADVVQLIRDRESVIREFAAYTDAAFLALA